MPIEEIQVKYINEPQAGKTLWNVKTPEGQYYGFFPDLRDSFQVGGTYKVDYDSKMFKGKMYRTIKKVRELSPPAPGASAAPGKRAEMTDLESERISTLAILKSFIESAQVKFTEDELVSAILTIRRAYRTGFGISTPAAPAPPPAPQKAKDDMDDEIPF